MQPEVVDVVRVGRREEIELVKDAATRQVGAQPIPNDRVRTQDEERAHAVRPAQPGDTGPDDRRLAPAGDDVQQQVSPLEHLVGVDRSQEPFALARPQRPLATGIENVSQEVLRLLANAEKALVSPHDVGLLIGEERVVHSAHRQCLTGNRLATEIVLDTYGDLEVTAVRKLVLCGQHRLALLGAL